MTNRNGRRRGPAQLKWTEKNVKRSGPAPSLRGLLLTDDLAQKVQIPESLVEKNR